MNTIIDYNRRGTPRCGYAIVVVLMFNVLFLLLVGVAWRQMGSVLRIATAQTEHKQTDKGIVRAEARALRMLETGRPPIGASADYKCCTAFKLNSTDSVDQYYLLTFTPITGTDVESWAIKVEAVDKDNIPSGTEKKLDNFTDNILPL